MKKLFIFAAIITCMTSCKTLRKTATTDAVNESITSYNTADLVVSPQKVSLTYDVPRKVRRGGRKNIENAAVRELLRQNGNADVLVAPEFETVSINGIFRHGIRTVVVTGYPATYKSFQKAK